MSKIKPLEKSKTGIYIKLIVVTIFIGLALAFDKFHPIGIKDSKEVLGVVTQNQRVIGREELTKSVTRISENYLTKAQDLVSEVINTTAENVQHAASAEAKKISGLVIDSTIGNLLKQIDKLPEPQQEEVKKYICK